MDVILGVATEQSSKEDPEIPLFHQNGSRAGASWKPGHCITVYQLHGHRSVSEDRVQDIEMWISSQQPVVFVGLA